MVKVHNCHVTWVSPSKEDLLAPRRGPRKSTVNANGTLVMYIHHRRMACSLLPCDACIISASPELEQARHGSWLRRNPSSTRDDAGRTAASHGWERQWKLKRGGGEKPKWEGGCPLPARHTCLLPISPPKSFSSILTRLELAKILDLLWVKQWPCEYRVNFGPSSSVINLSAKKKLSNKSYLQFLRVLVFFTNHEVDHEVTCPIFLNILICGPGKYMYSL
jgi:hypothetical protein